MKTIVTIVSTMAGFTAILYAIGKDDQKQREIDSLKKSNGYLTRNLTACQKTLDDAHHRLWHLDRGEADAMEKTYIHEREFQKIIRDF